MEGVLEMDKFNSFCEKYETVLWQAVAALWFYVEFFCNKGVESLFGDGVFWTVFAIVEAIAITVKSKKKNK